MQCVTSSKNTLYQQLMALGKLIILMMILLLNVCNKPLHHTTITEVSNLSETNSQNLRTFSSKRYRLRMYPKNMKKVNTKISAGYDNILPCFIKVAANELRERHKPMHCK